MKKDQQVVMNNYVVKNYSVMIDEFTKNYWYNAERLRSCKACVYETGNYFVLKSYETIVAFIDKNTRQKFDVLRYVYDYTFTSAQHISKFFHDYGDNRITAFTYRDV